MKVGIIGAGQLGWMMITEGRKLQHQYLVLSENPGPASKVADGNFSLRDYRRFVDKCDVVTPEFEHTNPSIFEYAQEQGKLLPSMDALSLKVDRSLEKSFLAEHGFPVAKFSVAREGAEAIKMAKAFGRSVIKASKGGYDGKGQYYFGETGRLPTEALTAPGYVVEEFIEFETEASIIASRDRDGVKLFHPPSLNKNLNGILFSNEAPCEDYGMKRITSRLMDSLGYVGVMAVEFFIVNGKAIVNEFAPRVHNSGHHTLHGSSISQFEQHIRVITDLPVTSPELFRPSGIVNAVGLNIDRHLQEAVLSIPETHSYSYGKQETRPGRKMGHVNLTAEGLKTLRKRSAQVVNALYGNDPSENFGS